MSPKRALSTMRGSRGSSRYTPPDSDLDSDDEYTPPESESEEEDLESHRGTTKSRRNIQQPQAARQAKLNAFRLDPLALLIQITFLAAVFLCLLVFQEKPRPISFLLVSTLYVFVIAYLDYCYYCLDRAAKAEGKKEVSETWLHTLDALGGLAAGIAYQEDTGHNARLKSFKNAAKWTKIVWLGVALVPLIAVIVRGNPQLWAWAKNDFANLMASAACLMVRFGNALAAIGNWSAPSGTGK